MELILSKELDQKIFNYISLLEKTNEELTETLGKCVELLTQFKSSVPARSTAGGNNARVGDL